MGCPSPNFQAWFSDTSYIRGVLERSNREFYMRLVGEEPRENLAIIGLESVDLKHFLVKSYLL